MSAFRRSFVLLLVSLAACSGPSGIPFHGEEALLDSFEWDSGLVPAGSPAQVRIAVRGGGGITVDAMGNASGDTLTASAGSGALESAGSLVREVFAKVDIGSIRIDETLVQEVGYEIPAQRAPFDPFLLEGESTTLESTLPPGELIRAPIPSVPGSTLVLSIEGGTLTTTFGGTCARAGGGYAQYLGRATIGGTVSLSATIEIEVPIVGSRSFGPFAIEVPIPAIERDVDLGLFEVSGARVESGPSPCSDAPDDGGVLGDGAVIPSSDGGVPFDGAAPLGDGGVRECIAAIEAPLGQACDYTTAGCLTDAGTPEQSEACLEADGAPELCEDCLRDEFRSCATAARCRGAYQAYGCCAREHCATLEGDRFRSCVDAFCFDGLETLNACFRELRGECPVTGLCFRAPR